VDLNKKLVNPTVIHEAFQHKTREFKQNGTIRIRILWLKTAW